MMKVNRVDWCLKLITAFIHGLQQSGRICAAAESNPVFGGGWKVGQLILQQLDAEV